ncbi:MAG: glycosyltransferase [Pseudomonadota bacterium]
MESSIQHLPNFDICICTYKRASLKDLLASLNRLDGLESFSVRVIIADNDDHPSAKPIVEEFRKSARFQITYVHAPKHNISVARNACLDEARAQWLIFIDDDETVSENWLLAFASEVEKTSADVYLGAVKAIYPDDTDDWLRTNDFHSTRVVYRKGRIVQGYTTNTCVRRSTIENFKLRFDPAFGKTGGEDTVFFSTLVTLGGKIAACPGALAYEAVPKSRLTLRWLCDRKYRSGYTQGLIWVNKTGYVKRIEIMVISVVKWMFCSICSLIAYGKTRSSYWRVRGALHHGVFAACLGLGQKELY